MLKYVIKKLITMLITLFVIATATFFILAAVPGDALTERVEKLPAQTRMNLYKKYGLDKPLMERYVITMVGLFKGDFGESILYPGQTVNKIIKEKLPASARLGLQQMIVGISVGMVLGIIAVMKKGTYIEYIILIVAVLFISVPHLVFGLGLQKIFAGTFRWFPVIGWPKGSQVWFGGWKYTVLPTLTGCFVYIASYSRLLKTSMLDVINQDYILTAQSKGLSESQIMRKHVLRNSFIPIMTTLPMSVAMSITGSFFIERIFAIPGLGMYYVTAVNGRDLPIILGETVIIAALYIVVVFLTDILYTVIDPRIRTNASKSMEA